MSTETEQQPAEEKKPLLEKVELGDGETFVGRDSLGAIQTIRADVTLKEGIHYNKISGKAAINSGGYNKLNQIACINLIKPNSTIVDGTLKPNPHVQMDPTGKYITMVWTRTVGIGFSPVGNLVLVDKSVVFNVWTYYVQSLQAKIKSAPACGVMGRSNNRPQSWKGIEEKWAKTTKGKSYKDKKEVTVKPNDDCDLVFIPIDCIIPPRGTDPGMFLGLWVDITHPEIQACYNEHMQRQRFADRIADTICGRNVLKAHPAIGMGDITDRLELDAGDKETGRAAVRVYGYKHSLELADFKKLSTSAEHGDLDAAKGVAGGDNMEIIVGEEPEEPGLDDVDDAAAGLVEDDETAKAAEKAKKEAEEKKPAPAPATEEKKPEPEPAKPAAGKKGPGTTKYKGLLAEVAQNLHPLQIVEIAEKRGFKARTYTELTEGEAEVVYLELKKQGAL